MPEAMRNDTAYVVVDHLGHKTRFIYRGRHPVTGRLRLEVAGAMREVAGLEEIAGGEYAALLEADVGHRRHVASLSPGMVRG